jgi:regulatory protein
VDRERKPPQRLASEALYDYALRALGRRALTERELRMRLERRAASATDIGPTIERLRSVGYLDDAKTAESHVEYRKEFEGLGQRRVYDELRRRGVDAELARGKVDEAYRGTDELELIREYLRRRMGRRLEQGLTDPAEAAKVVRRLQRAGFSSATIWKALDALSGGADWLEGLADAAPGPGSDDDIPSL